MLKERIAIFQLINKRLQVKIVINAPEIANKAEIMKDTVVLT